LSVLCLPDLSHETQNPNYNRKKTIIQCKRTQNIENHEFYRNNLTHNSLFQTTLWIVHLVFDAVTVNDG